MEPTGASPHALTAEDLARQDRWLRGLVRGLVAESEVDDVVQQTWAAAVASEGVGRGSRAWLGAVARRMALRAHRSRRHRADRERAAARAEVGQDTAEAWELLELQQNVLDAVKGLREPYATPILLRYVHGYPLAEVAERVGASEGAVRQRIKRGLDQLRADVGSRYAEDWRDLPALAPWLGIGTYTMKKSTMLVGAALLIGALTTTVILVKGGDQASGEAALEGLSKSAPDALPAAGPVEPVGAGSSRQAAADVAPDPAAGGEAKKVEAVHGLALSPAGRPLAGVRLGALPQSYGDIPVGGLIRPEEQCTSEDDGTFVLAGLSGLHRVASLDALVPLAFDQSHKPEAMRLILAPAVRASFRVQDAEGAPLADVRVSVEGVGLQDLAQDLNGLKLVGWGPAVTGESGEAVFAALPAGQGSLRFSKEGFVTQELDMPAMDDLGHGLVLERDPVAYTLRGWVRSPGGANVEGARVGLGDRVTSSAADGSFEIRILASEEKPKRDHLWATHAPWRGIVSRWVGRQLTDAASGELEVELVFEGEPLKISGRILRADGQPYAGLTLFPWYQRLVANKASVEELGAGDEGDQLNYGSGLRVWAKTDAEGRFELEGLQDQEYALHLVDKERQLSGKTDPVRAGTRDWIWTVPSTFEVEALVGHLVDRRGRGVAGVGLHSSYLVYSSDRGSSSRASDRRAVSDGDGRFVLHGVPGQNLMLQFGGKGIVLGMHSVGPTELDGSLQIRVEKEVRFQLELTGERRAATGFQVLDGAGEAMNLLATGGGEFGWSSYRLIKDGKTRVLGVGDSAATLVIYAQPDRELGRLPIQLASEGVESIVW